MKAGFLLYGCDGKVTSVEFQYDVPKLAPPENRTHFLLEVIEFTWPEETDVLLQIDTILSAGIPISRNLPALCQDVFRWGMCCSTKAGSPLESFNDKEYFFAAKKKVEEAELYFEGGFNWKPMDYIGDQQAEYGLDLFYPTKLPKAHWKILRVFQALCDSYGDDQMDVLVRELFTAGYRAGKKYHRKR